MNNNQKEFAKDYLEKSNRSICVLLAILFIILSCVGSIIYFQHKKPFNGMTLKKFNAIENGMTYAEVVQIVGERGSLLSHADLNIGDEYVSDVYMWYGENNISNAEVYFQGGKVTMKAQYGLK